MARIVTKIGDVFAVKINEKYKKYFQYIAKDLTQLNSSVIRVFNQLYSINSTPDINMVVLDKVDFYAHTVLRWGIEKGEWEKAGKAEYVGDTSTILFRGTSDYGVKLGEKPVEISNDWHIWRINDDDFTSVGILTGENRRAEIGSVIPAYQIVIRMKTGKYDFVYPGFE